MHNLVEIGALLMGIAQTKVTWEDAMGNVSDPVYFRFSTNDPKNDVLVAWSTDGKKYARIGSAPQEVLDAEKNSGLLGVARRLRIGIDGLKKKNPNYDGTKIPSESLIKQLNDYCDKNGVQAHWTDTNTDTPTKKEKTETDKKDISVVVSTGILKLNDGNTGNKKNVYVRYGFDKSVPYVERFDSKGKSLGRFSEAEMQSLLGKPYYEGAKKDPEEYSKDDNNAWDVIAKGLESKYMSSGKFKIPEVHFVKGEVDFNDMEQELNDSIGSREKDKADREATLKANFDRWEQEELDKKSTIGQNIIRAMKGLAKLAEKTGVKKFFYGS